jgi:hypothetical protein
MDHEIISWFHDVHSINTKEEFYELVKNHEVTISERYHGTILSLLAGVPAYGILRDSHSDKILSLFEELGVVSRTFEIENAEYEFPPYALEDVRSKLQAIRSNAVNAYHCFMDNLLSGASRNPPSHQDEIGGHLPSPGFHGPSLQPCHRLAPSKKRHYTLNRRLLLGHHCARQSMGNHLRARPKSRPAEGREGFWVNTRRLRAQRWWKHHGEQSAPWWRKRPAKLTRKTFGVGSQNRLNVERLQVFLATHTYTYAPSHWI